MVKCNRCQTPLDPQTFNSTSFAPCPHCRASYQIEVFPAYFKDITTQPIIEKLAADDDAGCFNHFQNKAVVVCDGCGRFLCDLCDISMGDTHICAKCLESDKIHPNIGPLDNQRQLYDNLAISLAAYPMLLIFPTFITAPIAFYLSIRYWKTPSSIIPRNRYRLVAAFILSLIQIVFWIWMVARGSLFDRVY